MKVAILYGGLGTRLREETEFRQKPMAEFRGRAIESMTSRSISIIPKYITDHTFLPIYGDGPSDVNLRDLHDGVTHFAERPKIDSWMRAGFVMLDRKVLDPVDGDDCIRERKPLARLANEGQFMADRHKGFFYAMDTDREYQHLSELSSRGMAAWKAWSNLEVAQCTY